MPMQICECCGQALPRRAAHFTLEQARALELFMNSWQIRGFNCTIGIDGVIGEVIEPSHIEIPDLDLAR